MKLYEAVKIEKKIKNNEEITNDEMTEYLKKKKDLNNYLFGNDINKGLHIVSEKIDKIMENSKNE